MMATRSIPVSIDLYAAIWRARLPGEESEEEILRRVLKVPVLQSPAPNASGSPTKIGFSDYRFGIELPEGFEIFRTYKGTEYRAKATNGSWKLLNTEETYPSLNQLSRAVSGNVENAWNNWYFRDKGGQRRLVTELRVNPNANSGPIRR